MTALHPAVQGSLTGEFVFSKEQLHGRTHRALAVLGLLERGQGALQAKSTQTEGAVRVKGSELRN